MEDTNYKALLGLMLKSMAETYEQSQPKNHQIILTIGATPAILTSLGMQKLPIAMTGKVVDKSYFDHGVTKATLEKIYPLIAQPKAIYQSTTIGQVVLTYELKNTQPLIVAMHPNKQLGGRSNFYNVVSSIYYKEGETPELKWVKQGLLMWRA